MRFVQPHPAGMAPFDPFQNARHSPTQKGNVLRQQHEAQRGHPQAKDRQDGKESRRYKNDAHRHAYPARRRATQPVDDSLKPRRKTTDKKVHPPFIILMKGFTG